MKEKTCGQCEFWEFMFDEDTIDHRKWFGICLDCDELLQSDSVACENFSSSSTSEDLDES